MRVGGGWRRGWRLGLVVLLAAVAHGSRGDTAPMFRQCVRQCTGVCETGSNAADTTAVRGGLLWPCPAECSYRCMWAIERVRGARGEPPVQYFGKWPFRRLWGVQEPLAALFSAGNGWIHARGVARFCSVDGGSAGAERWRWRWVLQGRMFVAAFLCAMVFHTRDTPVTEKLDYFSATAALLVTLWATLLQMAPDRPAVDWAAAVLFSTLYIWYACTMLQASHFDYGFHNAANAGLFGISGAMWCGWWYQTRPQRAHAWKAAAFTVCTGLAALAELFDFPPVFYSSLDAHALWHLLSMPCAALWWSFLYDEVVFSSARKHAP